MATFGDLYSQYYDLLYKEKDYEGEANYILSLIKKHAGRGKSIFELGCGTGMHASHFARNGYSVFGIDLSNEMLALAEKQRREFPSLLEFEQGNITTFKTNKKFDIAMSLFHVMCYVNSNEAVVDTFRNVSEQLNPGGIFIFDCWYGPGVLTDPPVVRVKRLENSNIEITRIAEPELIPNKNINIVNYTLFIRDKASSQISISKESHSVRYYFAPEIELIVESCGMSIVGLYKYMTDEAPSEKAWNAVFVCQKKSS